MATLAQIADLEYQLAVLQRSADARWACLTGANCFFMLLGFALLEAGSLRAKNIATVMLKQFIVATVVCSVWFLWGHGAAFGSSSDNPNSFIGTAQFALGNIHHDHPQEYVTFFFQMTFACVCCSIVSGAIGERMKFEVYFIFLFLMCGWIYPVVAHAQWSVNGWNSPFNDLSKTSKIVANSYIGVVDHAGAAAVHIVGGVCAIVGAWLVGPRRGRVDATTGELVPMPGHNSAFVAWGVMVLWFAWYSFVTGSPINNQPLQYKTAARAAANTAIASAASGLTTLLATSAASGFEVWSLTACLNAVLTGLVATVGGGHVVEPWAALVIGVCAALAYLSTSKLVISVFRVDDPVDAFAVHAGGGVVGLVLTGLLAQPDAMQVAYGTTTVAIPRRFAGAFMGGDGTLFGLQLVQIAFAAAWAFAFAFAYFWTVSKLFGLRVSATEEDQGLDSMFGEQGYDYLTPLQRMQALSANLTALQSMLSDGVAPTGDFETSSAALRLAGIGGGGGPNNASFADTVGSKRSSLCSSYGGSGSGSGVGSGSGSGGRGDANNTSNSVSAADACSRSLSQDVGSAAGESRGAETTSLGARTLDDDDDRVDGDDGDDGNDNAEDLHLVELGSITTNQRIEYEHDPMRVPTQALTTPTGISDQ